MKKWNKGVKMNTSIKEVKVELACANLNKQLDYLKDFSEQVFNFSKEFLIEEKNNIEVLGEKKEKKK